MLGLQYGRHKPGGAIGVTDRGHDFGVPRFFISKPLWIG